MKIQTNVEVQPLGPDEKLDLKKVTVIYTMFSHLGDFVVMGGLLRKFDLLGVEFESLVAHQGSPHVSLFQTDSANRFFNIASLRGALTLLKKLREARQRGRILLGIPMAPGSIQAFIFFWLLKKLGALTYIVDFNLVNADVITPPRRRYVFDRHLTQAAELFRRPEWLDDMSMPLAMACPEIAPEKTMRRVGFFPWSGRSWLPEFTWPQSRWLALAELILQEPDVEIVLLGRDTNYTKFAETLRTGLPEEMRSRFISEAATSVEDLVVGLRKIDCLVTLNTSALHLAHALKLPLVALCGSSLEIWQPEGGHVRIVRDTQGALPPSDKYYHDPLQPSLQRIEVAGVHSALIDIFSRCSSN